MAATRRLNKELGDLKKSEEPFLKCVQDLQPNAQTQFKWSATILPEKAPYDKGAFQIEITFPVEYPFKPPKVLMISKIYHPNINEKGEICLPIITPEQWKPATKVQHVLASLIALIELPEPDHPLRTDVAQEYLKDHKKFMKNAEEFTKKHSPRA